MAEVSVTDDRMKDRVKVMFNGPADSATSEHQVVQIPQQQGGAVPQQQQPQQQGAVPPSQALQVLTMAQRTAEEHLARAQQQADKIRTDALAAAEEIGREAQLHAHNVRGQAEKVLAEARAAAEQVARQAKERADEAQRSAAKVVLEARGEAGRITADAQANADQLRLAAQQRFDDVVGSLGARREALQGQIEALEQFDRDYRGRLTGFMQAQLRALWVEQPQVTGELTGGGDEVEAEIVEDTEETPARPGAHSSREA
jgi:cell division septum initiation protein DivIVA